MLLFLLTGGAYKSVIKELIVLVNNMTGNIKIQSQRHSTRFKIKIFLVILLNFVFHLSAVLLENMLPRFMFVAMKTPSMQHRF